RFIFFDGVGWLVNLPTNAIPNPINEPIAESAGHDDRARRAIHFLDDDTKPNGLDASSLHLMNEREHILQPIKRIPDNNHAHNVATVAIKRATEVEDDRVTVHDPARSRLVMGRHPVRSA